MEETINSEHCLKAIQMEKCNKRFSSIWLSLAIENDLNAVTKVLYSGFNAWENLFFSIHKLLHVSSVNSRFASINWIIFLIAKRFYWFTAHIPSLYYRNWVLSYYYTSCRLFICKRALALATGKSIFWFLFFFFFLFIERNLWVFVYVLFCLFMLFYLFHVEYEARKYSFAHISKYTIWENGWDCYYFSVHEFSHMLWKTDDDIIFSVLLMFTGIKNFCPFFCSFFRYSLLLLFCGI